MGMVQEPVQDRRGRRGVPEEVPPLAEVQVGGDDERTLLIDPGNQLEDVVRGGLIHGDEAELVPDDQVVAEDRAHPLLNGAVRERRIEISKQLVEGVVPNAVSRLHRLVTQGDGQVALAHTTRAAQGDVLLGLYEPQVGELSYCLAADGGLEGEVEVLQTLDLPETSGLETFLELGLLPGRDLLFHQVGYEIQVPRLLRSEERRVGQE